MYIQARPGLGAFVDILDEIGKLIPPILTAAKVQVPSLPKYPTVPQYPTAYPTAAPAVQYGTTQSQLTQYLPWALGAGLLLMWAVGRRK